MNYGPLVICVDYPKDLLARNKSVVVFIISNHNNKVRHVSVVEREALADWYTTKKILFKPEYHHYILSTTSIVGEIITLLDDKNSKYEPEASKIN